MCRENDKKIESLRGRRSKGSFGRVWSTKYARGKREGNALPSSLLPCARSSLPLPFQTHATQAKRSKEPAVMFMNIWQQMYIFLHGETHLCLGRKFTLNVRVLFSPTKRMPSRCIIHFDMVKTFINWVVRFMFADSTILGWSRNCFIFLPVVH